MHFHYLEINVLYFIILGHNVNALITVIKFDILTTWTAENLNNKIYMFLNRNMYRDY